MHDIVVGRSSRTCNGQQEMVVEVVRRRVVVESLTDSLQKQNHISGLGVVGGVLPINIDAIETQVLHKLNSAAGEHCAARGRRSGWSKVWRISPSTNTEQGLHLSVGLLEKVKLFDAAIHIGTDIIPGVGGVVLVGVCIGIAQVSAIIIRDMLFEWIRTEPYTSPVSGWTFAKA